MENLYIFDYWKQYFYDDRDLMRKMYNLEKIKKEIAFFKNKKNLPVALKGNKKKQLTRHIIQCGGSFIKTLAVSHKKFHNKKFPF